MLRDRTFRTLIIIFFMIIGVGTLRQSLITNSFYYANIPDSFWLQKANAEARYDIVLLGDSRVYRGISPEDMAIVLDGYEILNFGFSANGLNPQMYGLAEDKLASDGRQIMVLGISPYSLTPESAPNEHYTSIISQNPEPVSPFGSIALFQPITLQELNTLITNAPPTDYYYQEPRPDGWVASYRYPVNLEAGEQVYRDIFIDNQIESELVDALISQAGEWASNGVCVYAFRMPASNAVRQLEDTLSGFNEMSIQAQLETNGVIWIDIDPEQYNTYDGSHLNIDSARQFSQDIAQIIDDTPCPE